MLCRESGCRCISHLLCCCSSSCDCGFISACKLNHLIMFSAGFLRGFKLLVSATTFKADKNSQVWDLDLASFYSKPTTVSQNVSVLNDYLKVLHRLFNHCTVTNGPVHHYAPTIAKDIKIPYPKWEAKWFSLKLFLINTKKPLGLKLNKGH